jgi:hypothetical protein
MEAITLSSCFPEVSGLRGCYTDKCTVVFLSTLRPMPGNGSPKSLPNHYLYHIRTSLDVIDAV